MRILLVTPKFPESLWGLDRIRAITGKRYVTPTLALPPEYASAEVIVIVCGLSVVVAVADSHVTVMFVVSPPSTVNGPVAIVYGALGVVVVAV